MQPNQKPKIFFDGACPVCSIEMNRYQKNSKACDFEFIDIADKKFSARDEGLDPQKVNEIFHLKTSTGEVLTGVEAFRYIWKSLPGYQWAYNLSAHRPVRILLNFGYEIFWRVRPHLSKMKR